MTNLEQLYRVKGLLAAVEEDIIIEEHNLGYASDELLFHRDLLEQVETKVKRHTPNRTIILWLAKMIEESLDKEAKKIEWEVLSDFVNYCMDRSSDL